MRVPVSEKNSQCRQTWKGLGALLLGVCFAVVTRADDTTYIQEQEAWRAAYAHRLQSADGWLTIAGLYWLHPGPNPIGADPTNDLVLPAGSAPAHVGVFELDDTTVRFTAAEGVEVHQQGHVVRSATLTPGPGTGAAPPDALQVNALTFWLHQSGERLAIRLRNPHHPLRTAFTGCHWFPVSPPYRLVGRFLPYERPKAVTMANIMGDLEPYTSPGLVEFSLHGQQLRLEPVTTGTDRLFFVFRDQTSGQETYGAARFLVTAGPQDGQVVLDFNQAVNPPCAYNPYTTCPLPWPENHLPIRIEAGEMRYHE